MTVSIVVPAYNRAGLTQVCLEECRATTDAELVLVDNGSSDETPDLYPLADRVVRLGENVGFAAGCNRGAKAAAGDLVVFLNNDTRPEGNWCRTLARVFDDPEIGVAGCLLLYGDRSVQHAGVHLQLVNGTLTAFNTGRGDLLASRYCVPKDVEAVTGACMAVRRSAWNQLGGFDEHFWNGYEDVDLCLRARELGWRVWYEPRAVVVHYESQSGPERWTRVGENVRLLNDRWGARWQQTLST